MKHLVLFVSILCCSLNSISQEKVEVSFLVDMSEVIKTLGSKPEHVGVSGDIAPLSWSTPLEMRDKDGDGIYRTTLAFSPKDASEVMFKFRFNQTEWEGGSNRTITLKDSATTYEAEFRLAKPLENPFSHFIGQWTLKEDHWTYGNRNKTLNEIKIPNHFSDVKEINTKNSVFWLVDAGGVRGHYMWVFDRTQKKVYQLSSFTGPRRGIGEGSIDEKGNLVLDVAFEGEGENTYRTYTYTWVSKDEFTMDSVQYQNGKPTGDYYGGTFIRK